MINGTPSSFFTTLLLIPAQISSAQPSLIKFERISVEHGLSQATCSAIAQDSLGFMWFGTQEGVNRYDGRSFKIYRAFQKPDNGLRNHHIGRIVVDLKGNVWIATRLGLHLYNRKTDKFISFLNNPNDSTSLSANSLYTLLGDKSGTIWSGTGVGLNRFCWEDSSFVRYTYDPNNPNSIGEGSVYCIAEDNVGNILLGTSRGGLSVFNVKSETFTRYAHNPKKKNSVSGNAVAEIAIDSKGRFWLWVLGKGIDRFDPVTEEWLHYPINEIAKNIPLHDIRQLCFQDDSTLILATEGAGLIFLNINTGQRTSYMHAAGDRSSLSSNTVYAVFKDNTDTYWFGTGGGGVCKYNPRQKKFYSFQNDPNNNNSLNNNYIISILKDRQGKVWMGTRDGGLNVYDAASKKLKVYRNDPKKSRSVPTNLVTSLYSDSKGILWAGTPRGLCRYREKTDDFDIFRNNPSDSTSIGGDLVSSIAEDSEGNIWIGTFNGAVSKMNTYTEKFFSWQNVKDDSTSINDDSFHTLLPEKNGVVWVGGSDKGLNRLDTKTGKAVRFQFTPDDSTSISSNSIQALLRDRNGTLWVGTANGLCRYNEDETFTSFTTDDGFANNNINSMLEDSHGNLWLATNKGLTRFNPQQMEVHNFFKGDGLPGDEFVFGTPWKTEEGEMFFGNVSGALYFHPDSIKFNAFIPPVVFTEFQKFYTPAVLEKDISVTDKITVKYTENIFSFSFAALNYQQPEKNQYAYKLDGFSEEWIHLGNKNSVSFTNLDAGEYTLQIRGSNNDGVWNETPASMQIVILPPWWGTWWFRGFLMFIFVAAGPAVYYRRVTSLKRQQAMQQEFSRKLIESQEAERKRIANELHDSLGQNLLVIKNKLLLKQQEKTIEAEQLGEVSDLVSNTIQEVRSISHALRPHQLDQLGLTKTLRALVKSVGESSSLRINVQIYDIDGILNSDEEIGLYRIMQEALNNIVKHSGANNAAVSVSHKEGVIAVTISDAGKGMNVEEEQIREEHGKGFGLSGMQERAKMFGWFFEIQSIAGRGTTLNLRIPVGT